MIRTDLARELGLKGAATSMQVDWMDKKVTQVHTEQLIVGVRGARDATEGAEYHVALHTNGELVPRVIGSL